VTIKVEERTPAAAEWTAYQRLLELSSDTSFSADAAITGERGFSRNVPAS